MEREATMSWRVDELERQLESARHESQDRAAKVMEWATAAERGLEAVKVHLAETEVAL